MKALFAFLTSPTSLIRLCSFVAEFPRSNAVRIPSVSSASARFKRAQRTNRGSGLWSLDNSPNARAGDLSPASIRDLILIQAVQPSWRDASSPLCTTRYTPRPTTATRTNPTSATRCECLGFSLSKNEASFSRAGCVSRPSSSLNGCLGACSSIVEQIRAKTGVAREYKRSCATASSGATTQPIRLQPLDSRRTIGIWITGLAEEAKP